MMGMTAVTCFKCGESWGNAEGETLRLVESKEVLIEPMSLAERAAWDSVPEDGAIYQNCYDQLAR